MGSDGQHALEAQRGCVATGCGCRDGRIVSPRRAQFHAFLARERGETANRVIAPDPDWQLPTTMKRGDLK
jgi:hypothetical protein